MCAFECRSCSGSHLDVHMGGQESLDHMLTSGYMQDCALLAWSLGRLGYEDDGLFQGLEQQYISQSIQYPQPLPVITQMLKGFAISGMMTKELYDMLFQQADGQLGSPQQASKFLQVLHRACD
jgi:hypothetical protein